MNSANAHIAKSQVKSSRFSMRPRTSHKFVGSDATIALIAQRSLRVASAVIAALIPVLSSAQELPPVRLVVTNDVCWVSICPATHPPAPTSVESGEAFSIYVTAVDENNSLVRTLTNGVEISSTDSFATLPANFVFVPSDKAIRGFNYGAVLRTPGDQTITVKDPQGVLAPGSLTLKVTGTFFPVPVMSLLLKVVLAALLAFVGSWLAYIRV